MTLFFALLTLITSLSPRTGAVEITGRPPLESVALYDSQGCPRGGCAR